VKDHYSIVDISIRLASDYKMHTPAGVRDVQLEVEVIKGYDTPGGAGQLVRGFSARLHHGTHVDAPEHFVRGGKQINELSLSTFVGPAVVADVRNRRRKEMIVADELAKAIAPSYQPTDRLLIRTDWNEHYGEAGYLEGSPYLTMDAIEWCVEQKFPVVGLDFAHVKDDPAAPGKFFITRRFCETGVVTMGYVTNLSAIVNPRVLLVALPLALAGAEASPVRAVVLDGVF
jgi:arylformamidase